MIDAMHDLFTLSPQRLPNWQSFLGSSNLYPSVASHTLCTTVSLNEGA